jgi:glycosyltransferase involved in cell wall biosynthesis
MPKPSRRLEERVISVVLPTYNRAPTLPRAIDSVFGQTHRDWELIIVDDGSTDGTREVVASISDPRVRAYSHERNRGVTAAKNTGLDHVRCEWFTILDSDDEMTPDALASMLECAELTGATAVTCNCVDSVSGRKTGTGIARDGWLGVAERAKCRGEFWGITKTSLLGDLRFDERLPGFEETVWLKIDRRARRYYLHQALRVYHTEGMDRLTTPGHSRNLKERVASMCALGQDREYLGALREADPARHRRIMLRVHLARLLRLLTIAGRP